MSRYLEFRLLERKPKTRVIEVVSKRRGDRLGIIKWFSRWRRYAFFPETAIVLDAKIVFDAECLNDIASYMEKL